MELNTSIFSNKTLDNTKPLSLAGQTVWGRLVGVYDGDTITCIVFVFGDFFKVSVRIDGVDTCEMNSLDPLEKAKAIETRNAVISYLTSNQIERNEMYARSDIKRLLHINTYCVLLVCKNNDKYGRTLADVYPSSKTTTPLHHDASVTAMLLREFGSKGGAVEYHGGTKQNWHLT